MNLTRSKKKDLLYVAVAAFFFLTACVLQTVDDYISDLSVKKTIALLTQYIFFGLLAYWTASVISRNIGDFVECAEFDGEHGIMVYNRSLQRPGKANQIRPMEEWIVAVGKHPGIIAGSFADLMANKGYFYALFTVAQ